MEDNLEAKNLQHQGFESFYNKRTSSHGYFQSSRGFHERTDKELRGLFKRLLDWVLIF
jgi:hypothetical protein